MRTGSQALLLTSKSPSITNGFIFYFAGITKSTDLIDYIKNEHSFSNKQNIDNYYISQLSGSFEDDGVMICGSTYCTADQVMIEKSPCNQKKLGGLFDLDPTLVIFDSNLTTLRFSSYIGSFGAAQATLSFSPREIYVSVKTSSRIFPIKGNYLDPTLNGFSSGGFSCFLMDLIVPKGYTCSQSTYACVECSIGTYKDFHRRR
ncbi:hypothetical protein M0811_07926 [Anaeramoeba ignava]|uniref:Uncharacterized protein n=1 Tax=Anaeramoeba ignava TaxID=1746090 RepID=A0A9Q0LLA0_ANAIG|nr:hypothetical protein M0811_07926 [Anaeramoeba ignava]